MKMCRQKCVEQMVTYYSFHRKILNLRLGNVGEGEEWAREEWKIGGLWHVEGHSLTHSLTHSHTCKHTHTHTHTHTHKERETYTKIL